MRRAASVSCMPGRGEVTSLAAFSHWIGIMGWLIRIFLIGAGVVAGWFVPRDQLGYTVVQFVVVLLSILIVSIAVLYFPRLRSMFGQSSNKKAE